MTEEIKALNHSVLKAVREQIDVDLAAGAPRVAPESIVNNLWRRAALRVALPVVVQALAILSRETLPTIHSDMRVRCPMCDAEAVESWVAVPQEREATVFTTPMRCPTCKREWTPNPYNVFVYYKPDKEYQAEIKKKSLMIAYA